MNIDSESTRFICATDPRSIHFLALVYGIAISRKLPMTKLRTPGKAEAIFITSNGSDLSELTLA
jgi:hypothetical protein